MTTKFKARQVHQFEMTIPVCTDSNIHSVVSIRNYSRASGSEVTANSSHTMVCTKYYWRFNILALAYS